jgi:hypothetical protein
VVATVAGLAGVLVGTAVPSAAATPDLAPWSDRVCRGLVTFQADALDARERLWVTANAAPPVDRPTQKATVRALRAPVVASRRSLAALDATLARRVPKGRDTALLRDRLRSGLSPLTEAYDAAPVAVAGLADHPPGRVPRGAAGVLRTLDRAATRATDPLTRVERALRRSSANLTFASTPVCRAIGLERASVPASLDAPRTPQPPVVDPLAPGASDATAPALLLPGRFRPSARITELAASTAMTGLGRVLLYGAAPVIETGAPFVADCPSAATETSQILGCYRDGRIYILDVTRPELAGVVAVTVAHEMLHAAHEAARSPDREQADADLAAFYAATTDQRLQTIVAQYDARAPQNRATELHSLVPTQVPLLSPDLDAYFARYFRDRGPVVTAYDAYISVFEGLATRYDALVAEVDALRQQIDGLRGEAEGAGAEAERLAGQIDALRAQGRVGESNDLVPAQNASVRRAQGLDAEANALVDEHNAKVDELNALALELRGLETSLRPLG